MSATGDQNPTLEGQEGRVSPAGEWARAARVGSGMGPGSSADGGNMVPVVREAEVEGSEMVAVPGGAEGGMEEEEDVLAQAGSPEGGDTEEDSDIGPAEEEAGDLAASQDLVVDAHQFPMVGFRFMFLDLVRSLLHRVYYNDHILVRPYSRVLVQTRSPGPNGSGELPGLQLPQRPRVMAVSSEGEGLGLGPRAATTSVLEPQEPIHGAAARDAPELEEESAGEPTEVLEQAVDEDEIPRHQYDNLSEDDTDFGGEEEKEAEEEKDKENKEQEEGPENNLDPADNSSRKSSWEE